MKHGRNWKYHEVLGTAKWLNDAEGENEVTLS